MAINNAAVVVEPQAFISIDAPSCFNWNIFTNPRIMKFFNYSQHAAIVDGRRLCHYPNSLFFDIQDESEMIMSEFCRLEGPLPLWGNTFYTALACLYQLGFKDIYLIGCVFENKSGDYAHGNQLTDEEREFNTIQYNGVIDNLKQLMPLLIDEGMSIKTCHLNTPLDGICDFIEFEDAISNVVTKSTSIAFNEIKHASKT